MPGSTPSSQPPGKQQTASPPDTGRGPAPVTGVKRLFYFFLAGLFFILAIFGALLPVLPTTPFLLLTSYFLIRCSPRLNNRLLNSRWFGGLLRDWFQHRGIRRSVKIKSIGFVVLVAGLSLYVLRPGWLILIPTVILVFIGITVILSLRTVPGHPKEVKMDLFATGDQEKKKSEHGQH